MDVNPSKILSPVQIEALDLFFSEEAFRKSYYLTGGTALAAFYLGHRYSDDLDFFTHESQTPFLLPFLEQLHGRGLFEWESRTPYFIRIRYQKTLKVDFVHDVLFRAGVPWPKNEWRVDSLENILLNKITAIQGRLDVKDYVDLYYLLQGKSIEEIMKYLAMAGQKDSSVDPFVWSRVIGDVENFSLLPQMILPMDLDRLTGFYRDLRKSILKALKPK